MKKTLLLLSFISIGVMSGKAQITITDADVSTPPHVIYQATDTTHNCESVGVAGTNQTWNFSTLTQPLNDTLAFMPYGWAPNPKFSTANVVGKLGSQTTYSYMINSSSSLSALGNSAMVSPPGGTPVPANQINTPSEILMNFPATYGTTYTNDYVAKANFYVGQTISGFQVDSARQKAVIHKTVLIDAWGTLTTPLATYSVIRSKETKVQYDTSDAYIVIGVGSWNTVQTTADSTTTYVWWANGVGFPLATATMDSMGNVKKIQWLKTLPVLGINEYTAASVEKVYPNPAQNEINFVATADKQKAIAIYDVAGRLIETIAISNN